MHYFINRAFLRYQIWPKNALCSSGGICKISWSANRCSECDKCFSVRFESGVTLLTRGHCTELHIVYCSTMLLPREVVRVSGSSHFTDLVVFD